MQCTPAAVYGRLSDVVKLIANPANPTEQTSNDSGCHVVVIKTSDISAALHAMSIAISLSANGVSSAFAVCEIRPLKAITYPTQHPVAMNESANTAQITSLNLIVLSAPVDSNLAGCIKNICS